MESANTLRVKLIKRKNNGLGFLVKQRKEKPHVMISDLVTGGMAQESGLIKVGDIILRINDIDISDMSYESSVEILKSVPTDAPVVLLLRVPEGLTTHLETKFTDRGIPVTIRVTKPLTEELSFVGKLRKKLSRNPSVKSPDKSKTTRNKETNGVSKRDKNTKQPVDDDVFSDPIKSDLIDGSHAKFNIPPPNGTPILNHDHKMERKINLKGTEVVNVLEQGAPQSPEIVLTTTTEKNEETNDRLANCDMPKSDTKNSIEIVQDKEEITVIIKGDVKVQNGMGALQKPSPSPDNIRRRSLKPSDSAQEIINQKNLKRRESTPILSPRKGSQKLMTSPVQKRYCKLKNMADSNFVLLDTLHSKSVEAVACSNQRCMGSVMGGMLAPSRPPCVPREVEDIKVHAKDFIEQYYDSIKRANTPAHNKRLIEILSSISRTGTYDLTYSELVFGAKTAWRNAPRCIGRIQWSKLQVFDARHITTARGMFEAICTHIKYGTNKGNIRSAITIFPQRTDSSHDYRVWNVQLIRYAGYKQADGSFIGDPANVEFTEICQKLGWKGNGGMFDVLPLVLQANGQDPELFEIPSDLILEVQLKHPRYPWFEELGLKWYGLPAVSCLCLDVGGLEFTGVPFNGWYMGTEIGARDLCDVNRYNITEKVGIRMGLDVKKASSLWKDTVLVDVNLAVLHSFQTCGVTIADHHTASESFMKHIENEQRLRGGTPADWVWVVPPISGSICPVFHQEMLNYRLKPSYEYQEDPWKTHVWKKDRDKPRSKGEKQIRKIGFRELARAVKFSAKLMGKALARRVKCTILYATETGKSERFARVLCEIFKHAFDAKLMCMDVYDVVHLEHEALLLIVTSTFGNGDPPENGEEFAKWLYEMRHPSGISDNELKSGSYIRLSTSSDVETSTTSTYNDNDTLTESAGKLSNVRYSVFGLGSKAYPNLCAYAHYIDNIINELGGERVYKMVEGDELSGQEESFRSWAGEVFKAACETFCVGDDVNMNEAAGALTETEYSWAPNKFRLTPLDGEKEQSICQSLSNLHSKAVLACKHIEVKELQSKDADRQTILVKMDVDGHSELMHSPGDHLAVFPANSPDIVDRVLSRLNNSPPADQRIRVEMLQEKTGTFSKATGVSKNWCEFSKIPPSSLRTAFSWFLDITSPPTRALLKALSTTATKDSERERLETLASNSEAYEDWRNDNFPNIAEVFEEFSSLKVSPTLLITQLPLIQQRYYSISSSSAMFPGEIHLTVAILKYRTKGGSGPVHEGVCSNWLHRLKPGQSIPCFLKCASAFHLPDDSTVPVVMVGPGTGIAPFRSFWQQRKIDRDMQPVPSSDRRTGWGKMYLYFGCRQSKVDNIYSDELKQTQEDGVLNVYTAFSREQGTPKTYVQDLLLKNGREVFKTLVEEHGHFYVCGDVSMAADVTAALEQIMQTVGGMSADMANNFVIKMTDANRFHKDIFGVLLRASETVRESAKRAEKYLTTSSKPANTKDGKTAAPISNKPLVITSLQRENM